ncbi:MAG: DUF4159 domain-containing protein [Steroidobacteraceae bacterium]
MITLNLFHIPVWRHAWRKLALMASLLLVTMIAGSVEQRATTNQENLDHEFQFVRLIFTTHPQYGSRRWQESWTTDAPEAEQHLLGGINRLTLINTGTEGKNLSMMDDRIFNYPFIYAVDVGHWYLSDVEAQRMREHLLRGGFLMVDDFHGTQEWQIFIESMQRVFPDRTIVDVEDSDPIFHVLYDITERPDIPNINGAISGNYVEKDGITPYWRGIYDDDGRLMVMINFNVDLGDAWEHADNPLYPVLFTTTAYNFCINYLTYAMTH